MPDDLTIWQSALYFQLKALPQTIPQLMSANALPESEVARVLGELEALGLAREGGALGIG